MLDKSVTYRNINRHTKRRQHTMISFHDSPYACMESSPLVAPQYL